VSNSKKKNKKKFCNKADLTIEKLEQKKKKKKGLHLVATKK